VQRKNRAPAPLPPSLLQPIGSFPTHNYFLAVIEMSHHHTTTYYPRAGAQSRDSRYHITPGRTLPKMPGRVVEFVPASTTIFRPVRDDERDVVQRFIVHASHCLRYEDPYRVYVKGATLCERSHAHSRDVVYRLL
jgi:hypothetical protein